MSPRPDARLRVLQLILVCLAEVLAMALWFSASAVVPQLDTAWGLSGGERAWLTMSVQLGFVVGALASAFLTLSDRFPVRWVFAVGALTGAVANGLILVVAPDFGLVVLLRFVTGAALAGVYPPGMKLAVSWAGGRRGLGIGLLVGALTLGSALPHLLNALPWLGDGGMPPWPAVVAASSGLGLAAALIAALFLRPGPDLPPTAPFRLGQVGEVLRSRPTRLANLGYLGHMWELYAVWAWAPLYLLESFAAANRSAAGARLAGFGLVGIGAIGCVAAGWLADRLGRTRVTVASMAVSGGCALSVGWLDARPALLVVLCLVWGFAVVADSAQFSAAVSELTDRRYVGTALTLQTSLGFLLTLVTLRLTPVVVERFGWWLAFAVLALGPAAGIAAMLRLRRLPEAARMAGGRR